MQSYGEAPEHNHSSSYLALILHAQKANYKHKQSSSWAPSQ